MPRDFRKILLYKNVPFPTKKKGGPMTGFAHYKTYAELQAMALEPIDLTDPGRMTPERVEKMAIEAVGLTLLFPGERVDEAVMASLYKLSREAQALQFLRAMQAGEKVNSIEGVESENREALHTAMRDQFEPKQTAPKAQAAAQAAQRELEKLRLFLEKEEGRFTDLIQIGIGGSELGPKALALSLEAFHKPNRRLFFLSNVDPDDAAAILAQVDPKKTLVVVVSKSGTTLETLTNETLVRAHFEKNGLAPKEHFIAVTGEKSPMDDPSRYLASFYMWDYVGGRYSATSMVGGVALGFALGYERFLEILQGAHAMDRHALEAPAEKNLPLTSALLGIWNRNFLHLPTVAVIPYSQALHRFPAHLQQLEMESNGKRVDKKGHFVDFETGPIVWGEPGTNGQHSFYQLIHQGTGEVPLEFLGFRKSQRGSDLEVEGTLSQQKLIANLVAQSIALATGQKSENPNRFFPGNRPNRILFAEELTPYTLGAILAYYEHKVALQGAIWNINSFDQEGVQLGKVLAKQVLSLFQNKKKGYPLGEAYLRKMGLSK